MTKRTWIILTIVTLVLIGLGIAGYYLYRWYVSQKQIIHDTTDDTLPDTSNPTSDMYTDKDYRGQTSLPLGIQNNNPGNLRDSGDKWRGLDPAQKTYYGFLRFVTLAYGIRANITNLSNLIKAYGSIQRYISHYAPPTDGNDTQAYINSVCAYTGLSASTVPALDYNTLKLLIRAHYEVENGAGVWDYIGDEDIDAAFAMTPYAPVAA